MLWGLLLGACGAGAPLRTPTGEERAGEASSADRSSETTPQPPPSDTVSMTTDASPNFGCDGFDASKLSVAVEEADCDVQMPENCPSGSHIAFDPEQPCAVCAPDQPENRSCAWAESCLSPFLESIARTSGAKACHSDSDCSAWSVNAGCGPQHTIALKSSINEEVLAAAELYAQHNCSLCPGSREREQSPERTGGARCVSGACALE